VEEHESLVSRRMRLHSIEPGEDAELVEQGVLPLDAELIGDEATPAGGVHDHPRRHVLRPPWCQLHPDTGGAIAFEQHLLHRRPLDDLRPQLVRVPEEEQVEDIALDVVAVVLHRSGRREVRGSQGQELPLG
jgi:hypothetical protein